jgi:acyl carrier protein
MNKNIFFNELKDILELEDNIITEETEIHLTSLSTLSVMAFVYENFDIQVKTSDLHKIECVKDLIGLVGNEKFV